MSDSAASSSDYGSSKSATYKSCSDCRGTCVWVAELGTWLDKGLFWNRSQANSSSTCTSDENFMCQCILPGRPPDFPGDVEVTGCDCCWGCQWVWYHTTGIWFEDGLNYTACYGYHGEITQPCSPSSCGAGPTDPPIPIEWEGGSIYASVVMGCHTIT
jgi:hypothetical protein